MTDIDGDVLDLDGLIERLVATAAIGPQPEPGTSPEAKNTGSPRAPRPRIFEWELSALCATVTELLRSEPVQPNVPAPVHVIGDLHGQLGDLLRYFDRLGWPGPECSYLFLGDYVDRGKFSIETIALLYCLKAKYPKQMTLLRGNHEASSVNRIYGFYDDCKRRFGSPRVWKRFNSSFEWLPITALIADRIFCLHGGLSPDGDALDVITTAERPVETKGAVLDLLWSDPDKDITGWGENDRGMGHTFGPDVVAAFLKRHDLDLICRGHQVIEDGYEFFGNRSLVTIFSAPNYCGEFDNAGAALNVSKDLLCSFDILKPNLPGAMATAEASGRKTVSEQKAKKARAKSGKGKGRGK